MQTFISYCRPSRDLVKALAKDFEALGHAAWFDEELSGGQAWWNTILARIRACDLFAFGLTQDSVDSLACKLERTYAARLNKPILPILMADGVSMNLLPSDLSSIQYVDYRRHQDREAIIALAKALSRLPAAGALPDPLPEPPEAPLSYLGNLREQIEAPSLSFPEQTALVLKLKERSLEANAADDADDARTLLRALRRRDDLFAKVAAEIDGILAATGPRHAPVGSAPPVAKPPGPFSSSRPAPESPSSPPQGKWLATFRWLVATEERLELKALRRQHRSQFWQEPSVRTARVLFFGQPREYHLMGRILMRLFLALISFGIAAAIIAAAAR